MRSLCLLLSWAVAFGHGHGEGGRAVNFAASGTKRSWLHPLGYTLHEETFTSERLPLSAGGVIFTDPHATQLPFPNPGGEYAITGFKAEIVDKNGASVPLSEVYLHHWLIFNDKHRNLGVCGGFLAYTFGVGAESRGTPVEYPDGYGWVARSTDTWGANIHIFRTVGLEEHSNHSQTIKECIECHYGAGKGCKPSQSGDFSCCKDGSQCPVDGSVTGTKDYYFKYTVTYTTQVLQVTPLHVVVLDASNCQVEHSIQANDAHPVHETSLTWNSPVTGNIIFSVGHVHAGGINITLSVNGKEECVTIPQYGTEEGKAGNEKGYLVANPGCAKTIAVKQGDPIHVKSLYWVGTGVDPTGSLLPGGFHGGTMDYFYLAIDKGSIMNEHGPVADPGLLTWELHNDGVAV